MNFRSLVAVSLAWLCLCAVAHSVKVDQPGEAEEHSSNIVTGTVLAIYSRVTRDSSYERTHGLASVRVESIQKGDAVKRGDVIFVRYIADIKWIGNGGMPPGPGGHNNVPREGDRRKICLSMSPDGGFDVYYVSGFKLPDELVDAATQREKWPVFPAKQLPAGTTVAVADVAKFIDGDFRQPHYLVGTFAVSARNGGRAVLRSGELRIVAEYPPSIPTPAQDAIVSKDESCGFLISDIHRDRAGVIVIFVREIAIP